MASRSFRDRFFTPPVARALTSPSGILSLGVGAAVGILATLGTGGLAVPIAGVVGGLLGYGGRVALAIPKGERGPQVDPFGVDEPWRHAVQDAQQARNRFTEAVRTFRAGPLRESLQEIGGRLDQAVEECWNVAKQGQLVSDARKQIDDRQIRWELQQAAAQIPAGGAANPTQAKTIESLDAQLASATRMDELIAHTRDELGLLNARLDQTVTQAIELSVTNTSSGFAPVGDSVDDIVDSLTALREAMGSMDDPSTPAPLPAGLDAGASAGPYAAPVPPLPPVTQTEPPGQVQSSPGS